MTTSTWIFAVTFLCGMSQAYFNNVRPAYFNPPRYESCKESIEDLKALVEITQCLKPDPSCICPVCTSTLSEEVILKLVNALIYTVTQTCGFNGRGTCGIPVHNGGSTGGGSTGGGSSGGGSTGGGSTGLGNNGSGGSKPPLINLGVLDNENTAHLDVAGEKVIGVDIGSLGKGNNGSNNNNNNPSNKDGLVQVGLLNPDSLLNVGLAGSQLLNVALGGQSGSGGTSTPTGGSTSPPSTGPSSTNPTSTVLPVTPVQSSSGAVSNTTQSNDATGVANQNRVLTGNKGNVGSLNNTVVNQGLAAPSNLVGNTTSLNS